MALAYKKPEGMESIFESAAPINEPRYKEGDEIFQVTLDVIEHFTVSDVFTNRVDVFGDYIAAGHSLWRYLLDRVDGRGHGSFGEYEMGETYFGDFEKALRKAMDNKHAIEAHRHVIRGSDLHFHDAHSFAMMNGGGDEIHAHIARVGKVAVYEKAFSRYPFLFVFATEKKANAYFKKALQEASERSWPFETFKVSDVYRVSDDRWASFEYAERWGEFSYLGENIGYLNSIKPKKERGHAR